MSNPYECCNSKAKFIMQMHGNFKDSMVVPERLVDHFGGKISGTIKLEAPTGQIFDVGVAKKPNEMILRSGWEAFVGANQMEENYFLVFRHLGMSCFKVTVFDSHGEEKISCRAGTKNPTHDENPCAYCAEKSSSSWDDASDSDGCCRKPGKKPAAKYPSSDELSADDSGSESESMESDDFQGLSKDYVLAGRCHLTQEQEAEINVFVTELRSEIPLLVVMIKKTNVYHYLIIPKDYARAHFPHKNQFISLKLPGKNKAWSCKFFTGRDGSGGRLSLCEFVRDNRVKEGDICLFQPMTEVESTRFTFMVHLLHKAGRTDIGSTHGEDSLSEYGSIRSDDLETSSEVRYILPSRCQLDEEDEVGIDALVAKIQPEIPLLVVKMKKSNVNGPQATLVTPILHWVISKGYAAAHFPSESQTITFRLVGGKKWHPHFHVRPGNIGYVLNGRWFDFVRDNHLHEEDICLLQPINKSEGRRFTVMVHLLPKARSTRRSKCGDAVPGSNKKASTSCVKDELVDGPSDDSNRSGYVVTSVQYLKELSILFTADDVECHGKPLVLHRFQQADISSVQMVVSYELVPPSFRDHPPVAHLDMPCLAPPSLTERQRFFPIWKMSISRKKTLTLHQAGRGKAWHVKVRHRRMIPEGGWHEFVADNHLHAGDICLLEPVKNERLAMAFHIIRSEQYG
ncbi:B3 domain-containing protein Os03g0620400-like [Lolium rigidum]|uniref:B3 domain-containing protein Os03g0620400-like n=1 Tax=Lolium rigidum TaxID=89674 RepID=UPI001F5D6341|nr:B3 domain-containing protein Os03g0620400-like [Lolium rigidum]